jgi:hypothetical protein
MDYPLALTPTLSPGERFRPTGISRFEPLNGRGNGIAGFPTGEPADWKVGVTEESFMGRGLRWPRWAKSLNGEPSPALQNVLPLPGGEGWGEGERFSNCIDTA